MLKPYIGVTGFMNWQEVSEVLKVVPAKADRLLMAGVLASSKTIQGVTNKYPNRYPKPEQLGNIFIRHPQVLNLIHFNTKESDALYDQLITVLNLAGPFCHGFQLNVAWPSTEMLVRFAIKPYRTIMILQVGNHAFEMIGHSPEKLADKVAKEYAHLIDGILLDPSGGRGQMMNFEILLPYLRALKEKDLSVRLGVAGGLSANTVGLLTTLVSEFPDLCIDAEGRLRDKNDKLDIEAAKKYLEKSFEIFRKGKW